MTIAPSSLDTRNSSFPASGGESYGLHGSPRARTYFATVWAARGVRP